MKYVYPYRISVVREHTNRYAKVDCSHKLSEIAKELLADAATERFLVLFLDAKNRVQGFNEASVGSLSASIVHPRDTFRAAVIKGASAVMFVHNHPSGDPEPSSEDRECTKRLIRAGEILGIRVLDHIIIGDDQYYSFADNGMMDIAA